MPKLSRRHVLLGATAGLVACSPNPTLNPTPTLKVAPSVTPGWHDGLPEAPIRQSETTAICDIAPPQPRLIVAADDSHVAKVIGGYISQAPTAIWWGTGEFVTTFDAGDGTADRWLPDGTLLFAVGSAVVHFRPPIRRPVSSTADMHSSSRSAAASTRSPNSTTRPPGIWCSHPVPTIRFASSN